MAEFTKQACHRCNLRMEILEMVKYCVERTVFFLSENTEPTQEILIFIF